MAAHTKSLLLCLMLVMSMYIISSPEEKYATKGQITEAVFILQNKQRELNEYIQKLKKKLTDCFALKKKQSQTQQKKKPRLSHCALYQRILPPSIKEL